MRASTKSKTTLPLGCGELPRRLEREDNFENSRKLRCLANAVKVSSQGPGESRCRILMTASTLSPDIHSVRPPQKKSKSKLALGGTNRVFHLILER